MRGRLGYGWNMRARASTKCVSKRGGAGGSRAFPRGARREPAGEGPTAARRSGAWLNRTGRGGWLALALGMSSGCVSQESLGVGALSVVSSGVVNDPANRSLRFDILRFGIEEMCREMTNRGAPLKLSDESPVAGRFFARGCDAQVLEDRQSLVLRFSGRGYAWTNLSGRLGFESTGVVEYSADFQVHSDRMYVYFRPRNVGSVTFKPLMVESALARIGLGIGGIDAEALGRDIVTRQLQRGFTVIRYSEDGESEFAAGLIAKGTRPMRPFQVKRSRKRVIDNDRTELHSGQQDFVGGIEVSESGRTLTLHLRVEGAPAIDLLLLREADATEMVARYATQPGGATPRAPAVVDTSAVAGQPFSMDVRLPRGRYTLLLDNSPAAGRNGPPLGGGGARVDYLLQLSR